eukprot:jgi/Orpsp1_1/1179522/evm.model.c7180000069691.1
MDLNFTYFPKDWDIDNESLFKFYAKCLPYIKSEDDYEYIVQKHILFKIFGTGAIAYFVILGLMLIRYRNHYILQRQGKHFYFFLVGSLITSINSFLVQ